MQLENMELPIRIIFQIHLASAMINQQYGDNVWYIQ